MKIVTISCDICGTDIKGELSYYVFNEILMDKDLNPVAIKIEAHYCPECTKKVVEYTKTLYAQNRSTEPVDKSIVEGPADK